MTVWINTGKPKESDVSNWNDDVIEEFRANRGKVSGRFQGRDLLLLHTKGAKTGADRVNPLAYVRDGERLIVIASKGGAPTNPDWYHNLVANPTISVEVGTEKFEALAEVTAEPERTRLYAKLVTVMPGFADYLKKTTRQIPVIVLKPVK